MERKRLSFCHASMGILLVLISALCLFAQAPTGSVVGIVSDPSSSAVPNAQVKLRDVNTNFVQAFQTTSEGLYRFPAVVTGTYELSVEAQGFRKFVQSRIAVPAAQTVRLDVSLQLGEVTATVEVSAAAVQVDSETATLRGVVDRRRIQELPLNGRDVTKLVLLVPGTVDFAAGTYQQAFSFPGRSAVPTNGGRGNMVNFSMDGSNANDNYTNVGNPLPNPDVVQEIAVQTSNFSARYGQSGGAIVNIVTRSGTNALHGSVFEYFRNDALNAKNVFSGRTDGLKRNQFGFALGGPVALPAIYNGKDRTFFFTSYQGTLTRMLPTSNLVFLPTAEQRNGDFSALSKAIIDPATKKQFSGNIIPPDRIGAVAKKLYNYLPIPAPLPGYGAGATFMTIPNEEDLWEYLIKIDHQSSSKNQLSTRYFITNYHQPSYFEANNLVAARTGKDSRYQSLAINDTYIFRPNLINQSSFSYDRNETLGSEAGQLNFKNDFGVNIYAPTNRVQFAVSGYFSIDTGVAFRSPRNTFQYMDNLNYIRGRHLFSFGVSISRMQMALDNPTQVSGRFSYDGSVTGNQAADMVLDMPVSFSQNTGQYVQIRGTLYGFYAHDDFKVNRKLTLNLGLRYEPYWPYHDKRGRGNVFVPGRQSKVFPLAPEGFLYEGDEGIPRGCQFPDLNNLAPRIGFAWDPSGNHKFSVRGGYGIFYDLNPTKTLISSGSTTPFSTGLTIQNPPSVSDPYRDVGDPFPLPSFSATTPIPRPAGGSPRDLGNRVSYLQSWHLTLERELAPDLIGRVAYVGSKGTRLQSSYEQNPAVYIPGASSTRNTNARRIYAAQGVSGLETISTEGLSIYHGMQAQLTYRLRSSLALQGGYTFSKSIDNMSTVNGTSPQFFNPFNKNAYRGLSDFDTAHRFALSYVWSLPNPGSSRLARTLIGGWSTSGVISAQTGLPLYFRAGQDRSLSGWGQDLADLVGNPRISNPSMTAWFDKNAFALPPLGTFGNSGRGLLRAAGFANFDLSVSKDFAFAETRKLQLRGEFYNAFNHVNPGSPSTTFTSPTFTQITSYRGPRVLQLSLRFEF